MFHDHVTGFARHVNVPNIPPVARQQPNQRSAQGSHNNEMVLYLPSSNQVTQQVARTASAAQPMATPSAQLASVALPIASPALQPASTDGQQINWASKIAEVMRDQFGLKPKQQNLMYRTPYPAVYDQLPLPHQYKLSNFTKFSGQGEVSTVEHINRFIMQCGEAAQNNALRVRLFSMSLSG